MSTSIKSFCGYWWLSKADSVVTFEELPAALNYFFQTAKEGAIEQVAIFEDGSHPPRHITYSRFVCPPVTAPKKRASKRSRPATKWPMRDLGQK